MELLKNKKLTAQQCTPDEQDDLENTRMLTHTYAHKYYAYKHTLARCIINTRNSWCTRLPLCVYARASASLCMCLCERGYGLAFVHIFPWHNVHPNLSLKPVESDAVLKRNPFIIEIGSDGC